MSNAELHTFIIECVYRALSVCRIDRYDDYGVWDDFMSHSLRLGDAAEIVNEYC